VGSGQVFMPIFIPGGGANHAPSARYRHGIFMDEGGSHHQGLIKGL